MLKFVILEKLYLLSRTTKMGTGIELNAKEIYLQSIHGVFHYSGKGLAANDALVKEPTF